MRKGIKAMAVTGGVVAMTFLTEAFFPSGDLRWGVVVLGCAFVYWLAHITPDGFLVRLRRRLSFSGGKEKCVRVLQGAPEHAQPRVIPIRYGRENQHEKGGYEGLFFENHGEPAIDVVAHPVELGARTVTFSGPEIPYLGTGRHALSRRRRGRTARAPRHEPLSFVPGVATGHWRLGPARQPGRLTYKDTHGSTYETTYELGVDILNSDGSMVVRFVRVNKS